MSAPLSPELVAASMESLIQLVTSNEKQTPLQFLSKGTLIRKLFINVSLYNKFAVKTHFALICLELQLSQ